MNVDKHVLQSSIGNNPAAEGAFKGQALQRLPNCLHDPIICKEVKASNPEENGFTVK